MSLYKFLCIKYNFLHSKYLYQRDYEALSFEAIGRFQHSLLLTSNYGWLENLITNYPLRDTAICLLPVLPNGFPLRARPKTTMPHLSCQGCIENVRENRKNTLEIRRREFLSQVKLGCSSNHLDKRRCKQQTSCTTIQYYTIECPRDCWETSYKYVISINRSEQSEMKPQTGRIVVKSSSLSLVSVCL